MLGPGIGDRRRRRLLRAIALNVTELDTIAVLKAIARGTDARIPIVYVKRPVAIRLGVRRAKHAAIGHRRTRKTQGVCLKVLAAGSRHKLLEHRLGCRVFVGRKRELGQGHHRLLGVIAVSITCRNARDLGRRRNGLALVRVVEPRRSLDVYRRRNIQAGKHRVVRIVGIALGITGKTLTLQTAADCNLRVVLRLRKQKILVRDYARLARLEQTIGILRTTRKFAKHKAIMASGLFAGIAPVNRISLTVHLQRRMQVPRHIGGILTVKNTLREC